jgi:hypothetical protein
LENGGGDFFDGVSFHAYDYYNGFEGQFSNGNWYSAWDTTGPVISAKARYIRSVLSAYGYPDKYLINSENALLCGRDGTEPECQTEIFNLTKAYYIVQSTTMALSEGLQGNIWYDLRGWRGSALVDQNRQPLIAYQAYQYAIQMLDGMAAWGKIDLNAGISGYEFRRDEHVVWVVWSLDGSVHELTLPDKTIAVYDLYGSNIMPSAQTLSVTLAPLYVEWEAVP